ncbi:MAG: tetratricopeptide repeat protein [Pseudobdellovibrionaceae bacterium]
MQLEVHRPTVTDLDQRPDQQVFEFERNKIVIPEVEKMLISAHTLKLHGEDNIALNLLRKILNLDSWNFSALQMSAEILEKKKNYKEALVVRKAAAQVKADVHCFLALADLYYHLEMLDEALQMYFECLALIRTECLELFNIYKSIGNIYVQQKDFDGAFEQYNKAYGLNPLSDVLIVNLGTLEIQRDNWDSALECFRKAISLNVKNDKAWLGLALAHDHRGDFELSWANIIQALDINPYNRTALRVLLQWKTKYKKSDSVFEYLVEYLTIDFQDEEFGLVLVDVLCQMNLFEWAVMECQKIIDLNPYNAKFFDLKKIIINLKDKKN